MDQTTSMSISSESKLEASNLLAWIVKLGILQYETKFKKNDQRMSLKYEKTQQNHLVIFSDKGHRYKYLYNWANKLTDLRQLKDFTQASVKKHRRWILIKSRNTAFDYYILHATIHWISQCRGSIWPRTKGNDPWDFQKTNMCLSGLKMNCHIFYVCLLKISKLNQL